MSPTIVLLLTGMRLIAVPSCRMITTFARLAKSLTYGHGPAHRYVVSDRDVENVVDADLVDPSLRTVRSSGRILNSPNPRMRIRKLPEAATEFPLGPKVERVRNLTARNAGERSV
jgi:hypothetical protein